MLRRMRPQKLFIFNGKQFATKYSLKPKLKNHTFWESKISHLLHQDHANEDGEPRAEDRPVHHRQGHGQVEHAVEQGLER